MSTESLESRMLGNLHVRFGVGVGAQFSGLHHVVCELANGRLKFDNYGGAWGQQQELDRFLQMYAVEKAKLEARRRGYSVSEQSLMDGSIKLSIQVAGGDA